MSDKSPLALEHAKIGLTAVVTTLVLYAAVELWALRPVVIIMLSGLLAVMLNE